MPQRDPANKGKIVLRKGGGIFDAQGNAILSFDEDMTIVGLTTTGDSILGDASADTLTVNATSTFLAPVTVGVDDTGHDVQFFGATSGSHLLWDESVDTLKLVASALEVGTTLLATGLVTMTAGIDAKVIFASTETIAAAGTTTALDLTKFHHDIDADAGGDIFTLADGVQGQIVTCVLKSSTGLATITPATMLGGTSVTITVAGASVLLRFQTTLGWSVVGGNAFTVI